MNNNIGNILTRKQYISFLSILSALSVVLLHSNGCFWTVSDERWWITSNIIQSICYFAVPVFFMIAGSNLLDYQEKYSTKDYFKKRFKKVIIPYIFWTIIILIYMIITNRFNIKEININLLIDGLLRGTSIINIFWFFPILISIYLCIPLFASIDKSKKKNILIYLALIGFIINCFIPFVIKILGLEFGISIQLYVSLNYLLYIIIGYLLDKYDMQKRDRILIYILGIIGLLMHFLGTHFLSLRAGYIVETFKGYNNVPTVMYSVGIFVFSKELFKKIKSIKLIDIVSKYTFEIYLMHWIIIDCLRRTILVDINTKSIIYRAGIPFVIIPIIILITWLLRKIPIVKKIVP